MTDKSPEGVAKVVGEPDPLDASWIPDPHVELFGLTVVESADIQMNQRVAEEIAANINKALAPLVAKAQAITTYAKELGTIDNNVSVMVEISRLKAKAQAAEGLAEAINQVLACGIEHQDPRIDYRTVQITDEVVDQMHEALAAYRSAAKGNK